MSNFERFFLGEGFIMAGGLILLHMVVCNPGVFLIAGVAIALVALGLRVLRRPAARERNNG